MTFWIGIGAVVGAILGAMSSGIVGALLLALIGAGIGALIGRSIRRSPSPSGTQAPPPSPRYGERAETAALNNVVPQLDASLAAELLRRLDRLDARLASIEARLDGRAVVPAQAAPAVDRIDVAPEPVPAEESPPPRPSEPPPVDLVRAPDGTLQAHGGAAPRGVDVGEPIVAADVDTPPARPAYGGGDSQPAAPSMLWRWLTGGNAVTRIGIVILFFGVAFLLTYFAEVVTVPIEWKLAGAGAGGIALAVLGVALARRRPAYGLSLQGAGMGVG